MSNEQECPDYIPGFGPKILQKPYKVVGREYHPHLNLTVYRQF